MVLLARFSQTICGGIRTMKNPWTNPFVICGVQSGKIYKNIAYRNSLLKVGVSNRWVTTAFGFIDKPSTIDANFPSKLHLRVTTIQMSSSASSDPPEEEVSNTRARLVEPTVAEDTEADKPAKKKKSKIERVTMSNVGRRVPDRIIHLIDENGDSLGPTHRADAIKMSEERDLKLVLASPNAKPHPVYKLMSGKDLHENRMKLREKQSSKPKPTTSKEIKLSGNISENDLNIKKKHIHGWLQKGHHVKIIVNDNRKVMRTTFEYKEELIEKLMEEIQDIATLNSKPKATGSESRNLQCVLRLLSDKERALLRKKKKQEEEERKQNQNDSRKSVKDEPKST
ncbi:translation initiation factor IF-3, mitochondrial-like [Ptychodera flava]|uniref:translation initiation factor IF-3, mitochondrial-like n=1 Tax=Ptychodera flava TaxID=63121 RepID=UPI00396A7892